jgi:hypothetical protein
VPRSYLVRSRPLVLEYMYPLEWSRFDADQSEIVDGRSFLWRRPPFLIEKAILMLKNSGRMCLRADGHPNTGDAVAGGLPRRFVYCLQDFARTSLSF